MYAGGRKPDNTLWRVGVTDPKDTGDIIGVMPAEDMAIVSSGDYRRYFVVDNTVYHHIIDPGQGTLPIPAAELQCSLLRL